MKHRPHLLILGGTSEAYGLADSLADLVAGGTIRITTSLAGRTAQPRRPQGELRLGGFGGVRGFAAYLTAHGVTAVIDATHPFAQTIGQNAATACAQVGVPLLRLDRPPWHPTKGDRWHSVPSWAAACQVMVHLGLRRPLLAIGRNDLAAFANQPDVCFVIRAVDDPGQGTAAFQQAFAQATVLLDRGPFAFAAEKALLQSQQCDSVICKNAGGAAGAAKLSAARALGLPVILRARPPRPAIPLVDSLQGALGWLATQMKG